MEISGETMALLVKDNHFSKTDLRVWMYLLDNICSPTELMRKLGISQSQAYKSCNKLSETGWIEVKAAAGNRKWYRAKLN